MEEKEEVEGKDEEEGEEEKREGEKTPKRLPIFQEMLQFSWAIKLIWKFGFQISMTKRWV